LGARLFIPFGERDASPQDTSEDLSEARTILERVVARNPQLTSPRALLGQVYSRLKLKKEAEEQQRIIQSLEEQAQRRAGPDTAASDLGGRK
jgi:hypothetical protein